MRGLAVVSVGVALLAAGDARAELRTRTRDLGAASSPAGIVDWSRSWSADWTTGTSTPTPDVECESAGSGGDLVCNVAAMKSGNPTTVGAPGYPARTAVRLDGTGDSWSLGNAVNVNGGNFLICADVRADSLSGVAHAVAKYISGGYQFSLYRNGASLFCGAYQTAGTGQALNIGTLTVGTYFPVCCSLTVVGAGTSVLRGNFAGSATSRSDASATDSSTAVVSVGSDSGGGGLWIGDVLNARIWVGANAPTSAAEMAALVASQQARLAAKPLGAAVTVTSGATTCDSRGDGSLYSLPAGSLCCGAAGCEVWGAAEHSNALTHSTPNATNWTLSAGTTIADASATCPLGPTGVRMAQVNSTGAYFVGVNLNAAGISRSVYLARVTGDSACNVVWSDSTTADYKTIAVSDVPTRYWSSLAGNHGIIVAGANASSCTRWCMDMAQVNGGVVMGPFSPTAGTPFTGAADVGTVASVLTNKDRWALGIAATPAGGWTLANGLLQWGGAYGAANSVSLYVDASAKLILEVFDNAGTPDWKRWTSTAALTGTTEKQIVVANNGGTWTVYVDGVSVAGSLSGTGTGVQTALPATATVSIGTSGSSKLNGAARKVCQARDYAGCRKALQ